MAGDEKARHRLFKRLERVIGVEEAGTLMELTPQSGAGDLATRNDVDGVRSEMSQLGTQLRNEMSQLGKDFRSEMQHTADVLRIEMRDTARGLFFAIAGLFVAVQGLMLAALKFL